MQLSVGNGEIPYKPLASLPSTDDLIAAYVRAVDETAAAIRMPELFGDRPHALHKVANRNGVAVIALRTSSLSGEQLVQLMTYRLAQYLVTDFVDPRMAYEWEMEHEPLNHTSPDDVHV